jgi:hypothetical protein
VLQLIETQIEPVYLFLLCNVILHIWIPQNFHVIMYEHLKLCLKM